jgi:hypothetical protein
MDILKFSAHRLYLTANILLKVERAVEKLSPEAQAGPIYGSVQATMLDMVTKIRDECAAISLSMSLVTAESLIRAIEQKERWDRIRDLHKELNGRIQDEIRENVFLFIPKTQVQFFEDSWPEVTTAFPSSEYDIRESGKSLATNRSTACVFHAMRVLEHGLRALASQFNVSFEHKAWGEVIEKTDKAIRQISQRPNKPPEWKTDEQFYSEAALQFMHFKNAWRNYTAHLQFKYTETEAEAIYRHVRDFMGHLAKRLKEP